MSPSKNLSVNLYYLCLINLCFSLARAARFVISNNCSYTVWAAAVPGGGKQLDPRGGTWNLDVQSGTNGVDCVDEDEATATRRKLKPAAYSISQESGPPHVGILASTMCSNGGPFLCQTSGTPPITLAEYALNQHINLDLFDGEVLEPVLASRARIWPRTGCSFDGAGRGKCQTGDCGGLLQCQAYGAPPNTLVEYALNQYNNLDFFDISLVDGFNVPMEFSPTSNGCTRGIRCTADIIGQCPFVLRAPGGCNNPCTVFHNDQYCNNPSDYSRFFKDCCPDAYSYSKDDQASTFTCPGGTNYKVTFCP